MERYHSHICFSFSGSVAERKGATRIMLSFSAGSTTGRYAGGYQLAAVRVAVFIIGTQLLLRGNVSSFGFRPAYSSYFSSSNKVTCLVSRGGHAVTQPATIQQVPVVQRGEEFSTTTLFSATAAEDIDQDASTEEDADADDIFEEFAMFLQKKQAEIIDELETRDGGDVKFSKDKWGMFEDQKEDNSKPLQLRTSGGITRVIQEGNVIEKGACSFTEIRNGILSAERAKAISGRNPDDNLDVKEGDTYSAAALSIVLHTRSPLVPTFRSDVRIFLVRSSAESGKTAAWFGVS
jgi:hypothetical protein